MITDEKMLNQLSEKIIGCAFKVGNKLGYGFLEKCYENALAHELRKLGLVVQQQFSIPVCYDEITVGEYVADLIVENSILIELKAISGLETIHSAQCINYLAATRMPICLLINFSKRVEVKRIVGQSYPNLSVNISAPSVANINNESKE